MRTVELSLRSPIFHTLRGTGRDRRNGLLLRFNATEATSKASSLHGEHKDREVVRQSVPAGSPFGCGLSVQSKKPFGSDRLEGLGHFAGHLSRHHVRQHVTLEVHHAPLPLYAGQSSPQTAARMPSWSFLSDFRIPFWRYNQKLWIGDFSKDAVYLPSLK